MVQGLDRLKRRLDAIPRKVLDAVKVEMERQAEALCEDIRRLAPRGETGNLDLSIGWTWGAPPKGTIAIASRAGSKLVPALTVYAGGGPAFYAFFLEYGTQHAPAHPFFGPVWRARRKSVRAALTRAVRKAATQT